MIAVAHILRVLHDDFGPAVAFAWLAAVKPLRNERNQRTNENRTAASNSDAVRMVFPAAAGDEQTTGPDSPVFAHLWGRSKRGVP
jgi:hypothetical protein